MVLRPDRGSKKKVDKQELRPVEDIVCSKEPKLHGDDGWEQMGSLCTGPERTIQEDVDRWEQEILNDHSSEVIMDRSATRQIAEPQILSPLEFRRM